MKKLILILLAPALFFAQKKDPDKILDELKKRFDSIEDYSADVTIKLDVDFLKIPETKAKVYFKKPDKVKLDAKGFAMLPKEGLNFSPTKMLLGDYSSVYIKSEKINDVDCDVVKVIPNSDSTDVVLTTLWISVENKNFIKTETTTKNKGTFAVYFTYDQKKYPLPSFVEFNFNMPPGGVGQIINQNSADETNKHKRNKMSGSVKVVYKNYQINTGLSDDVFKK